MNNSFAIKFPEIAAEWNSVKNGNIDLCNVSFGSHEKYWWICEKGHEWRTELRRRTIHCSVCPYCCNQKVYHGNCLETCFPGLSTEWHPTNNGNITPRDVIAGSNKKYWWVCKKGHEWQANPSKRIEGKGCPYCSVPARKVCHENCLATLRPEIVSEWHPIKNGNITPKDVIAGSNKKYWWLCKKGHEWKISPNGRRRGSGCPYCSNNILCEDNCLATKFPEIAAEWHPTKNGNITPRDVIAGSGRRYWFQCKNGHEWKTILANRSQGNDCPRCCESKGEKRLIEIAKQLLDEKHIIKYKQQHKDPRIKIIRPLPFDMALFFNDATCVVEFHGKHHYKPVNWSGKMTEDEMFDNFQQVKLHDKCKRILCKKYGIKYLAIRYNQLEEMQNIIIGFLNGHGLI